MLIFYCHKVEIEVLKKGRCGALLRPLECCPQLHQLVIKHIHIIHICIVVWKLMPVGNAISVGLCVCIKELDAKLIFMTFCIGEFYIKTVVNKYKCWLKSGNSNEPARFCVYFECKLNSIYGSEKRVIEKNETHFSFTHVFHAPYFRGI
jgi:hypothetical protein